jgi:hypothetical protein
MKRLKQIFKRAVIVLLSIASVLVLIVAFLNWRASRKVEARLAPLREAGKPIAIEDLQPSSIPDEQNAAKAVEPYSAALESFNRQLAEATHSLETNTQGIAGYILVAKGVAKEFPRLNDALRTAAAMPVYQPELDYSLDPSSFMDQVLNQPVSPRTIVRALYEHGLMSLAEGKPDDAAEDAIAILNWSQLIAKQPLVVNQLVSTACYSQGVKLAAKCLYADGTSPDMRASLMRTCSNESAMLANHSIAIDTERAFGIASFDSFPGSRWMWLLGELVAYLDVMAEFQSIAVHPTGLAPNEPNNPSIFARLTWPAIQQSIVALRRQQALSRATLILAASQGADDTAPSSLIDPFDGSEMRVKPVGDSIAVYSVGADLVDDGGSIEDGRDIGIAP